MPCRPQVLSTVALQWFDELGAERSDVSTQLTSAKVADMIRVRKSNRQRVVAIRIQPTEMHKRRTSEPPAEALAPRRARADWIARGLALLGVINIGVSWAKDYWTTIRQEVQFDCTSAETVDLRDAPASATLIRYAIEQHDRVVKWPWLCTASNTGAASVTIDRFGERRFGVESSPILYDETGTSRRPLPFTVKAGEVARFLYYEDVVVDDNAARAFEKHLLSGPPPSHRELVRSLVDECIRVSVSDGDPANESLNSSRANILRIRAHENLTRAWATLVSIESLTGPQCEQFKAIEKEL